MLLKYRKNKLLCVYGKKVKRITDGYSNNYLRENILYAHAFHNAYLFKSSQIVKSQSSCVLLNNIILQSTIQIVKTLSG